MTRETEQFDQLPDALVERLAARDRAVSVLTPAVDRIVIDTAREQFAPRRARPRRVRRWHMATAAAAAVALIAVVVVRPIDEPAVDAGRLADDIDGSGQVDILDAFALAKRRQDDPDAVEESRIDELTNRIVSLTATEAVL